MEDQKTKRPTMDNKAATFVWIAYSAFIFIDPVFNPSFRLWLGTLAVFLVFLVAFYRYAITCDQKLRYAMVAIIFSLGLITLPWNSGGITFFIYAAAFLPFVCDNAYLTFGFVALECVIMLAETYWLHSIGWRVSPISGWMGSLLTLIVGGSNYFFAKQRKSNVKLRMAQEEIEALAAVAERERIARDLHDVLGHTLSLIVLKSELAGRLIATNPQRATEEITEVERTARTALAEVREAIGGYRARGLAAEIEAARKTLNTAGVTLHVEAADSTETKLTATEESVLALALREAVTNIVRHAHAHTCRLRFVTSNGQRRFIIEDDGQHAEAREGNGLRGMRERVESLGGQLLLSRDTGTRLELQLPQ
ncbi:sensor histidine kinase [Terriglobus roseus]|uniref:Two-component system, NarL family, sensor histidine kinase DesK n=1 Tax=Terriglobus roseus TaxID=392734 RepID=A0A1G7KLX6_9BACT|nr:sensor histidine kinase [Terriglobus roseus]SDF38268.1 two-component system, NarL family, sensor histidine kinase DesK [Terriglobus roseus]